MSTPSYRERIAHYRAELTIDKHALDDELIKLPVAIQELAEMAGELGLEVEACKQQADNAYATALSAATASVDAVTGKPLSLERSKALAQVDDAYVTAMDRQLTWRNLQRAADAVLSGMRQKAESVRVLAQLHSIGYMAPTATYDRTRAEYIQARKEAPPARTRPRPTT